MSTNRKKIIFFLPFGIGGAQRMIITIAKMLSIDKYEVIFVTFYDKHNKSIENLPVPENYKHFVIETFLPQKTSKIPILSVLQGGLHYVKYLFSVPKVRTFLKEERPDAIFCSLTYFNNLILLASKGLPIKKIVRLNNYLSIENGLVRKFIRKIYLNADVIVAQQTDMARDYCRYAPELLKKITVLNNPVDYQMVLSRAEGISPYSKGEENIFLWAGNVSRKKGQDIAIKAFAKVKNKLSNAHLYFIGKEHKGSFVETCHNIVHELELDEYVHFMGLQSNPYPWIKNCNCFVLPSRIEGLPNAMVEAMILGKPVAATRCMPFIDEMLKHGYNGYVCEPENPDALADAMLNAIKLKNFEMTYHPSSKAEIEKIFK